MPYTAEQILKNLHESGIYEEKETPTSPADDTPVNVDRTDPLCPVDVSVPPPRLPRTSTNQSMTPRRDS